MYGVGVEAVSQQLFDGARVVPQRCPRPDPGADTAAGDRVHDVAGPLQAAQRPDVRPSFRATCPERDAHRGTGQPAPEPGGIHGGFDAVHIARGQGGERRVRCAVCGQHGHRPVAVIEQLGQVAAIGTHLQEYRPGRGRGVEPGTQLVRRGDPATGRGRPADRADSGTGLVQHGQRRGTGRSGGRDRDHRPGPATWFSHQRGDPGGCGRGALDQPTAQHPGQIGQQHGVTGRNGQERLPRQLRHRAGHPREQRRRTRLAREQRDLPYDVARPLPPQQCSAVAVQYVQHAALDKVEAVAAVPRIAQHRAGRQHAGPQLRVQLVACCLVEPVKQSLAHDLPSRPASSILRCRVPPPQPAPRPARREDRSRTYPVPGGHQPPAEQLSQSGCTAGATAYDNILFGSTAANRLPRTTPTGSTRAPAGNTFITATCRLGWLPSVECCLSACHDQEPALQMDLHGLHQPRPQCSRARAIAAWSISSQMDSSFQRNPDRLTVTVNLRAAGEPHHW